MAERVAVIGLGSAGVTALKNLLEEGFDAVGFEKNAYIGGLWRYTADQDVVSVTQQTRANVSTLKFAFTDFPWPYDPGNYAMASDVANYLDMYAEHFNLLPHCRFGLGIQKLDRSKDSDGWDVTLKDKEGNSITETFSKVLVTTGPQSRPARPKFEGMQHFKGQIIHQREYKQPELFKGKRVAVLGIANSACDTAVELSKHADQVYLCYRNGLGIVSRVPDGHRPSDHIMSRRINTIALTLNQRFPHVLGMLSAWALGMKMKRDSTVLPEWRLLSMRPIANVGAVINDHILSLLKSGRVQSRHSIASFNEDGHSLTLDNGETLSNMDAVILSTGYEYDYSYLGPSADPSLYPTPEWDNHPNRNNMPYPYLYHGLISLEHPKSLAFIGVYRGHTISAFVNADVAATAIAQIWKGNYVLPSHQEMLNWCDANYRSMLRHIRHFRTIQVSQSPTHFDRWLNEVSGNGINEKLGRGWEGWKFMFQNFKLYRLLMDGVDLPYVYRLFESPRGPTGRKRWEGAEKAIRTGNEESAKLK